MEDVKMSRGRCEKVKSSSMSLRVLAICVSNELNAWLKSTFHALCMTCVTDRLIYVNVGK